MLENRDKRRKEIIEKIFLQVKERQESSILKEPLEVSRTNVKRFTPENPSKMNRFQGLKNKQSESFQREKKAYSMIADK